MRQQAQARPLSRPTGNGRRAATGSGPTSGASCGRSPPTAARGALAAMAGGIMDTRRGAALDGMGTVPWRECPQRFSAGG